MPRAASRAPVAIGRCEDDVHHLPGPVGDQQEARVDLERLHEFGPPLGPGLFIAGPPHRQHSGDIVEGRLTDAKCRPDQPLEPAPFFTKVGGIIAP